ncbi:hypothetical protein GCM10010954_10770 [Halobacillus andaensis]|uniref:Uncharacterized protein n=1 Tax=Halobacillus andaensis TaxID=1176239 RepID=A0A917ETK4_HALAA|nr:hypothetical protein [Halobacillus andaensis]MBP2003868.1 hypothetical protein [Halobacillus andaensis]GGF13858.1 hypothetical protein GCM10010954_10770 [Halobacillus andaensis]
MNSDRKFNLSLGLFVIGIALAVIIHPLFGLVTIVGGSLLGFSHFSSKQMKKKEGKLLYCGAFTYLFLIMSAGYILAVLFLKL